MSDKTKPGIEQVATAVVQCFTSPNECDRNGETANVVDGLFAIARALDGVADAIAGRGAKDE
jgi:hypothetical protein